MTREEAIAILDGFKHNPLFNEQHFEAFDMAISVLSAEGDFISRQAILDELEKWDWQELYLPIHFKQVLDDVPSVENKGEWIPVSERLPYNHEYIKNNGLFNVSDGNRSYFAWFDIYDTQQFGEPTMSGFRVDYAVIAWMPLPEPMKVGET